MDLNINIETIFYRYDIQDETYLENCKTALELVKKNKKLFDLIEGLCNNLYDSCDYNVIEEIRAKTYEELFGEFARNHFLTNLVALIGLAGNERCEEKELVHNILLYGNSGMRVRQMVFILYRQ